MSGCTRPKNVLIRHTLPGSPAPARKMHGAMDGGDSQQVLRRARSDPSIPGERAKVLTFAPPLPPARKNSNSIAGQVRAFSPLRAQRLVLRRLALPPTN